MLVFYHMHRLHLIIFTMSYPVTHVRLINQFASREYKIEHTLATRNVDHIAAIVFVSVV